MELGEWKIQEMTLPGKQIPERLQIEVLCEFKRATMMDGCGYRAWHAWALLNFRLALQINEREESQGNSGRKRGAPLVFDRGESYGGELTLRYRMRETFFGPLIEQVEARIVEQQGDRWDREFFENHLTGYTVR